MFGRKPIGPPPADAPDMAASATSVLAVPAPESATAVATPSRANLAADRRSESLRTAYARIQAALYDRIDAAAAIKLGADELHRQIRELIAEVVTEQRLSLSVREQEALGATVVDDMLGLGPLEPLLARRERSPTSWSTVRSRSMSSGAASSN